MRTQSLSIWIPLARRRKDGSKRGPVSTSLRPRPLRRPDGAVVSNSKFIASTITCLRSNRPSARERRRPLRSIDFSKLRRQRISLSRQNYYLVAFFDCCMTWAILPEPRNTLEHARRGRHVDDVEPLAGDLSPDNVNPIGRLCYAASTRSSSPASSQRILARPRAQAGPARLEKVIRAGAASRMSAGPPRRRCTWCIEKQRR